MLCPCLAHNAYFCKAGCCPHLSSTHHPANAPVHCCRLLRIHFVAQTAAPCARALLAHAPTTLGKIYVSAIRSMLLPHCCCCCPHCCCAHIVAVSIHERPHCCCALRPLPEPMPKSSLVNRYQTCWLGSKECCTLEPDEITIPFITRKV